MKTITIISIFVMLLLFFTTVVLATPENTITTEFKISVNNSRVSITNNQSTITFRCDTGYESTQPLVVDCTPAIRNNTGETLNALEKLSEIFYNYVDAFNGTTPYTYAILLTNYTLLNISYTQCMDDLSVAQNYKLQNDACQKSLAEYTTGDGCKKSQNNALYFVCGIGGLFVGYLLGKKSRGKTTEQDLMMSG